MLFKTFLARPKKKFNISLIIFIYGISEMYQGNYSYKIYKIGITHYKI